MLYRHKGKQIKYFSFQCSTFKVIFILQFYDLIINSQTLTRNLKKSSENTSRQTDFETNYEFHHVICNQYWITFASNLPSTEYNAQTHL